jgi:uncharacterized protein
MWSGAEMREFLSLIAGLLFGVGLVVSGMSNPGKVLNFLDIAGRWDPSLMFVMAGAVAVSFVGFRMIRRMSSPLTGGTFHWPTATDIDAPLVIGAVAFGLGWGLSGFCPGPALTAVSTFAPGALVFIGTMIVGLLAGRIRLRIITGQRRALEG